jgi:uncharacterized protein YsxB (DUF464 family)
MVEVQILLSDQGFPIEVIAKGHCNSQDVQTLEGSAVCAALSILFRTMQEMAVMSPQLLRLVLGEGFVQLKVVPEFLTERAEGHLQFLIEALYLLAKNYHHQIRTTVILQ